MMHGKLFNYGMEDGQEKWTDDAIELFPVPVAEDLIPTGPYGSVKRLHFLVRPQVHHRKRRISRRLGTGRTRCLV
jgi:hypothetical protein